MCYHSNCKIQTVRYNCRGKNTKFKENIHFYLLQILLFSLITASPQQFITSTPHTIKALTYHNFLYNGDLPICNLLLTSKMAYAILNVLLKKSKRIEYYIENDAYA